MQNGMWRWTALLVSGAVLLAGAGAAAARPASKAPIVIGFANPLTGSEASYGVSDYDAAKLAVAQVNNSGGVLGGRQLKLLPYDTKGDVATGVAGANDFVAQHVAAVVGFFNSSITLPASAILHKAGIPLVSAASTEPQLTEQGFKNVFRVCGTDNFQGTVEADYLYNVLHLKTAVAINDEEVYGQGVSKFFVKEFQKDGGKVLKQEGISATQTDFSALLTSIKALNPQVIQFGGFYTAAGLMIKQARGLGIKAAFMSDDGTVGPEYTQIGGTATLSTYVSSEPSPQILASAKTFIKQYVARYHQQPTEFAGYNYDALEVLAAAISRAGSTSGAKIDAALATTKSYQGVTGPVTFSSIGDNISAYYEIFKVVNTAKGLNYKAIWNPSAK